MKRISANPRFYYITGCDGTGKSTQVRMLIQNFRKKGVKVKHVWLRYPFFFSVPLLAYARMRGLSWREVNDGYKHGYWNFQHSWLMRRVFPWLLLLDAAMATCWKIYLPIFAGWTVVCERFTLDMLVDLVVACQDQAIPSRLPGRLYLKLIPTKSQLILLELDQSMIVQRRPNLVYDRMLGYRVETFRALAALQQYQVLSNVLPAESVNLEILRIIGM